MKKLSFAVVALALTAGIIAVAGEEGPWFDLENCAFCKNLSAEPGMLDAMHWENHVIDEGMLTVTQVPEQYREAWARARKHMQETGEKMQAGEALHLCGFCQSYGKLLQAGAKVEEIDGDVVKITLMTSDDPEVVKAIQAHAQRTIDEYKKMVEAQGVGG